VQHDCHRRRPKRPGQGQHVVQEGPEEDLRSRQLQDGSRPGRVSRKDHGLHYREAVRNLRPPASTSLSPDHPSCASPNAEGGLPRGAQGGLPSRSGQPTQGEAAYATEMVHQEGRG